MVNKQRQRKTRSRWYGGGRRGWPLVKYGMIWFGIGVVITIGTYVFAVSRGGGTYLVSYGPIIVGLVCMARGGFDMSRQRRAGGSAARPAGASPMQGAGMPPGQEFGHAPGQGFGQAPGYGYGYGGPQEETMAGPGAPAYDGYGTQAGAMAGRGAQARDAYGDGSWQGSRGEPRQARPGYGEARQGRPGYGQEAPPNSAAPQPNWYPDPGNQAMLRWWDGQTWTNHTRPLN